MNILAYVALQEGRVHVIYSYNDQDPANDSALFYHGPATRGHKEISLLSEYEQIVDLPADIRRLEFLQRNVSRSNTFFQFSQNLQLN